MAEALKTHQRRIISNGNLACLCHIQFQVVNGQLDLVAADRKENWHWWWNEGFQDNQSYLCDIQFLPLNETQENNFNDKRVLKATGKL